MPAPARFIQRLGQAIALGLAAVASASEYRETDDFADAIEAVERYTSEHGAERTLLVIDIDNTLLTMQGDLGSDPWFEWQEYLLKQEPDSPDLVADDFAGLLEVQGLLFTLGKMRPSQEDLPALVRHAQDLGARTLVLTSRGPMFRPATERELEAAGYDFASTLIAMRDVPAGEFLPVDPSDPGAVGLTPEEVELFQLSGPRTVSLDQGVFMVAGQHKGAMLLTALHRAIEPPKAVVFVDDHGRHVHRVYDALARRGIESTVVHYKRLDDRVARFRYSDKTELTARWRRLDAALKEVFDLPREQSSGEPVAAGH